MERLKVITVPADELDSPGVLHIAFTVYSESAGALRASAGWTLKDAIELYARDNEYCGTASGCNGRSSARKTTCAGTESICSGRGWEQRDISGSNTRTAEVGRSFRITNGLCCSV